MTGQTFALFLLWPALVTAQNNQPNWTVEEKPIVEQLRGVRKLGDDVRPNVTKQLALQIRKLPATHSRLALAESLAHLATEGDPGQDAMQEVANTLAQSIDKGATADSYATLAGLVRYELVRTSIDCPEYRAAMSQLEAADQRRQSVDFTLTDLQGKTWAMKDLRGKTVLLNFWATWCPPCRKEMPDMEALHREFQDQGLVVLAISDEEEEKVRPFIAEKKFTFPILLDPGRKVNDLLQVEGIPKSFLYDREGRLIAQAMDMRTRRQFLEMLAQAGIK